MKMKCNDINNRLDEYLDNALNEQEQWAFEQHIANCTACADQVQQTVSLLDGLKQLPVEAPYEDFHHRVFAEVRRHYVEKPANHPRFNFAAGFATAAIAGLAIWLVSSLYLPETAVPQPQMISIAMNQTQTVSLVFDAPSDLQQVELSIDLPHNMELEGYPGHRGLSWQTSLHKGQNVLALPLLAIQPGQGHLLAQLSYGDKVKTFSVALKTTLNGVQSNQLKVLKLMS